MVEGGFLLGGSHVGHELKPSSVLGSHSKTTKMQVLWNVNTWAAQAGEWNTRFTS